MITESSSILATSMLMANGIDLSVTSMADIGHDSSSWPTTCSQSSSLNEQKAVISSLTPPPESTGFPPAYPYPWLPTQSYSFPTLSSQSVPGSLSTLSVAECYLRGSSLEDSPLSSPGSSNDGSSSYQEAQPLLDDPFGQSSSCPSTTSMVFGMNRAPSPLVSHLYSGQTIDFMAALPTYEYASSHTTPIAGESITQSSLGTGQKTVKMPQSKSVTLILIITACCTKITVDDFLSVFKNYYFYHTLVFFIIVGKGGIQLWQFMYSLLTDPDKKYSNIIEWTANIKEREFRMLEPEAIAVWWGHHKNKPNMSYDKFSRSLRYYYDKGILKKIPGERYVYRFLIDPEHMYRHIGISECRPKLKPMPQAAKLAMTKHHVEQGAAHNSPIVTPAPEPLMASGLDNSPTSSSPMDVAASSKAIDITTCTSTMYNNSKRPPPYSYAVSSLLTTSGNQLQVGGPIYSSASTGNLTDLGKNSYTDTTPPIKRSRSLDCPHSAGAASNTTFNHHSSSSNLPTSSGHFMSSYDDFSPLPALSAESSFLDNPMLLTSQGGIDSMVNGFNFVPCETALSTTSTTVTSTGLFTQQAGNSGKVPFSLPTQDHCFTSQWN